MVAYPTKPITIITPSKAGGSTDTSARIFTKTARNIWQDRTLSSKMFPGAVDRKALKRFKELQAETQKFYDTTPW